MTADPMITKDYLRTLHLYSYEDVQEFLEINRTLEREMEKPIEQRDMDLIGECLDYIELIMSEESKTDEATLEAKYQQAVATLAERSTEAPCKVLKPKKHRGFKTFFILAAAITVLITTLTIAARVYGYKNAWEFVYQKAIEIMELDTGDTIQNSEITIICDGQIETYPSIEAFLVKEKLNILYPSSLPDGLSIKNIYRIENATNDYYTIHFANNELSILIRNEYLVDISSYRYFDVLTINQTEFYISQNQDNSYQAIAQYGGYEYSINSCDYDSLIAIIQNMKGITS